MVIIGHARQDEVGGIEGAIVGDQTGNEIRTEEWYPRKNGWKRYLRPLDPAMADRAAAFVEQICANDNYGYSQPNRSSGRKAIIANGGEIEGASGDFDCSKLIFDAYDFAGAPVGSGSTHDLERKFMATGLFESHSEPEYLESGALSERGGIYLAAGEHTAMVLSNTEAAMPDGDETDAPEEMGETPVPDVELPYVEIVTHGRYGVRVRTSPVDGPKARPNAMFGERLPYLGTDETTGWHQVDTGNGVGWITWKSKYVRLVK